MLPKETPKRLISKDQSDIFGIHGLLKDYFRKDSNKLLKLAGELMKNGCLIMHENTNLVHKVPFIYFDQAYTP